MSEETELHELIQAVVDGDPDRVVDATNKALAAGIGPLKIIEDGLTKGLRIVGKEYENGNVFLLDLVAAAEASKKALNEILEPILLKTKAERKSLGTIVIGTVAGDIHDIGKNIVAAMLFASGFEVHDLGKDVPVSEFIKSETEVNADVVASSALLTTTMPVQVEILKALVAEGLREKVKFLVGGTPVTEEWAREIGADGFAASAVEAVNLTKKLLNIKD